MVLLLLPNLRNQTVVSGPACHPAARKPRASLLVSGATTHGDRGDVLGFSQSSGKTRPEPRANFASTLGGKITGQYEIQLVQCYFCPVWKFQVTWKLRSPTRFALPVSSNSAGLVHHFALLTIDNARPTYLSAAPLGRIRSTSRTMRRPRHADQRRPVLTAPFPEWPWRPCFRPTPASGLSQTPAGAPQMSGNRDPTKGDGDGLLWRFQSGAAPRQPGSPNWT